MSRLVIVAYAINGRGMGHLVRQLSILRWVRRYLAVLDVKAECWVLTTSEADTLARREGFPSLKLPSKAMLRDAGLDPARYLAVSRSWVLNAIAGLQPDLLLVDTFPGGSYGELVAALELAKHRVLVAREVKASTAQEDGYRALLPLYERQIVPHEAGSGPILLREREELLPRAEARAQLGIKDDRRVVYLTLGGGGDVAAPAGLPRLVDALLPKGWHLVIGAGPLYDGPERRGNGITWIDRYVPMELYQGFDAAVSAGGYNAYHELLYAGVPTVFWPQERLADDQAERCRRAEAAGAARVATRLEEIPSLLEAPGDPERARDLVPLNGARAAALLALETVLPAADLALAARAVTPRLLGCLPRGVELDLAELFRAFAGGTPAELQQRQVVLGELSELGHAVPELAGLEDPSRRIEAWVRLFTHHQVPAETATTLLRTVRKKFPLAQGEALLSGLSALLGTWAPFADWMGALSLLQALPSQREYTLERYAEDLSRWLARETDLFDALRRFAHAENAGERSLSEVLASLSEGGAP